MDLNSLLRRNRASLLAAPADLTPRDKRAYDQFARDFAEQTALTRAALLGPGS